MRKVVFYQTARGESPVNEFLKELDLRTRAKVERFVDLLREHGEHLHRPYVDHLEGPIRELRIRLSSDNIRILFFFLYRSHIVLLHAIRKKTMEVPQEDIQKAMSRMNDFLKQLERGEIEI